MNTRCDSLAPQILTSAAGAPPVRQTVATEIVLLADQVASRALAIADSMGTKLTPVMGPPSTPSTNCCAPGETPKGTEYPPLFQEMRQRLNTINAALSDLEDIRQRVEI